MRKLILIVLCYFIVVNCNAQIVQQDRQAFYDAKIHLENMLVGIETPSYERAIFAIENAWYGNQITEEDFTQAINFHLQAVKSLIQNNYNLKSIVQKPNLLNSQEEIIFYLSNKSTFSPLMKLINPILELIHYYGYSERLYRFLYHLPSILLPVCVVFLLLKSSRKYFNLVEVY